MRTRNQTKAEAQTLAQGNVHTLAKADSKHHKDVMMSGASTITHIAVHPNGPTPRIRPRIHAPTHVPAPTEDDPGYDSGLLSDDADEVTECPPRDPNRSPISRPISGYGRFQNNSAQIAKILASMGIDPSRLHDLINPPTSKLKAPKRKAAVAKGAGVKKSRAIKVVQSSTTTSSTRAARAAARDAFKVSQNLQGKQLEKIKPVEPVSPMKPLNLIKPVNPIKPVTLVKPVTFVKPVNPTKPVKKVKQVNAKVASKVVDVPKAKNVLKAKESSKVNKKDDTIIKEYQNRDGSTWFGTAHGRDNYMQTTRRHGRELARRGTTGRAVAINAVTAPNAPLLSVNYVLKENKAKGKKK